MLKKILQNDVQLTKKLVESATRVTWTRSLRNHSKLFEVLLFYNITACKSSSIFVVIFERKKERDL